MTGHLSKAAATRESRLERAVLPADLHQIVRSGRRVASMCCRALCAPAVTHGRLLTMTFSFDKPEATMTAMMLADALDGGRVRITSVDLDGEAAAWLGAVGLNEGEELVVLRRAILGGPLHVRTGGGGEFAVAREVAAHIGVVALGRESESTQP
jgi:ferrous iron transport protein A